MHPCRTLLLLLVASVKISSIGLVKAKCETTVHLEVRHSCEDRGFSSLFGFVSQLWFLLLLHMFSERYFCAPIFKSAVLSCQKKSSLVVFVIEIVFFLLCQLHNCSSILFV